MENPRTTIKNLLFLPYNNYYYYYYYYYYYCCCCGTCYCSCLRHCATSQKVMGSIPVGVYEIFHCLSPSGC